MTDGKTIAVPLVPAATTTAAENCAQGWTQCPAEVGGLCCPSGWQCGTATCNSVAATETKAVDKAQPVVNGAGLSRGSGGCHYVSGAVVVAVAMWVL